MSAVSNLLNLDSSSFISAYIQSKSRIKANAVAGVSQKRTHSQSTNAVIQERNITSATHAARHFRQAGNLFPTSTYTLAKSRISACTVANVLHNVRDFIITCETHNEDDSNDSVGESSTQKLHDTIG